ncbi:hypothetical protein ACLB1T_05990 [Escherichia coli]
MDAFALVLLTARRLLLTVSVNSLNVRRAQARCWQLTLDALGKALKEPARPMVAIVGGSTDLPN